MLLRSGKRAGAPGLDTPPEEREKCSSDMTSTGTPGLIDLPEEILNKISQYLKIRDVCVLKRSCKKLHATITPSIMSRLYAQKYYCSDREELKHVMTPTFGPGTILAKRLVSLFSQYHKNDIPDHPVYVGALHRALSNQKYQTTPCIKTLTGHNDCIKGVIQLIDRRLVSYSNDLTLKIWDLTQSGGQKCIKTLTGHSKLFKGVIQLRDGRLVSCADDLTLKIWDIYVQADEMNR